MITPSRLTHLNADSAMTVAAALWALDVECSFCRNYGWRSTFCPSLFPILGGGHTFREDLLPLRPPSHGLFPQTPRTLREASTVISIHAPLSRVCVATDKYDRMAPSETMVKQYKQRQANRTIPLYAVQSLCSHLALVNYYSRRRIVIHSLNLD